MDTDLNAPLSRSDTTSIWFTGPRVERIGAICASLLEQPTTWIDRRKDSVSVLDDTAVRWKNSVDFELPQTTPVVEERTEDSAEDLFCAPLFVLPKRPSDYMAFDLDDEKGTALSLTSRMDNARVSSAVLQAMADAIVGPSLDETVKAELHEIAMGEPRAGKRLARRRIRPLDTDPSSAQWNALAANPRFCWWLLTLADSSVVAVLFRGNQSQRKRIRLSYEAGLEARSDLKLRLGWDAYAFLIDNPFIEARSYHFEAQAPSGMRIERAWLNDDSADSPKVGGSSMRRVHLYRPDAESAGAGAGTLRLRVAAEGFLTGAWFAAMLAMLALVVSALFTSSIARNPTSAPALFLLLPGLIASYVGRPDRHALTTRLLSTARLLLIGCGFVAYIAGVAVALTGGVTKESPQFDDRVAQLRWWLMPCAGLATAAWIVLSIGVIRSSPALRAWTQPGKWKTMYQKLWRRGFRLSDVVRREPNTCIIEMHGDVDSPLPRRPGDVEVVELTDLARGRLAISQSRWYGTWIFLLTSTADEGGALIEIAGHLRARFALRWLRGLFVRRVEQRLRQPLARYTERYH